MPSPKKFTFDPAKDIPDLSGKVIFITGGTAGLEKENVLALAVHNPSRIYFTGRSASRATSTLDAVNVTFVQCDMESLSSVASTARQFLETSDRLDILLCNAGVMGTPPALMKDGYEQQFGVDHLTHALFIKLSLHTLLLTASLPNDDVRIVCLTSLGYKCHPPGGIRFDTLKTTQDGFNGPWFRYGQSKLANLLYAAELARRYPQITTVSVHPGVVATPLVTDLSWSKRLLIELANIGEILEPHQGAYNQLWCATVEKGKIVKGALYEPVGVVGKLTRESKNQELAGRLWEWTQGELQRFEV